MKTNNTKESERETLRKREIVRKYLVIQEIIEKGVKFSGKHINIFYLRNQSKKIGFIVSKKYKKSVQRNRLKRLMREAYRKNKQIFPGGRMLFFVKHSKNLPSYQEISNDVMYITQKKLINVK